MNQGMKKAAGLAVSSGAAEAAAKGIAGWWARRRAKKAAEKVAADFARADRSGAAVEGLELKAAADGPALAVITVRGRMRVEAIDRVYAQIKRALPWRIPVVVLEDSIGLGLFTAAGVRMRMEQAAAVAVEITAPEFEEWRAASLAALADAADAAAAIGVTSVIDRLEGAAMRIATVKYAPAPLAESDRDLLFDVVRVERDHAIGQGARAIDALGLILADPHGCQFCDSGTLRTAGKGHADGCGFAAARAVLEGGAVDSAALTAAGAKGPAAAESRG